MYFRLPFAVSGTKTAIPDTQPGNGAINFTTGYSNVYQLDPDTDPLALRLERDKFNELQYQITATLKTLYENGIPPFIETADNNGAPYSYSKDALVKRAGVVYSSNVNSNTTAPPGANWTVVDMAVFNAKAPTASPVFTGNPTAPTPLTGNVSTSIATTQFVRAIMALYGHGTANAFAIPNLNVLSDGGMFQYGAGTSNAPSANVGTLIHMPWENSSGAVQVAFDIATGAVYSRVRAFSTWLPWYRIYTSQDSMAITARGFNGNGYWRVYSDLTIETYSNVTYLGAQATYTLPTSIYPTTARLFVQPIMSHQITPTTLHIPINVSSNTITIGAGAPTSVLSIHTMSTPP